MSARVEIFASPDGFDTQPSIPSMLSADEKALYYEIARGYTGAGAIVEMGPWMGSGTVQICRGLAQTGHDWSLTVIDRFRWNELYASRYPGMGLKDGDEFESRFRQNLSPWLDRITCVATELAELTKVYTPPDDIELLYVDAPKSWAMLWSILNIFGPKLRPGARLVFQDYLHITSRQLIWLLASVRQLAPTLVVREGTSVAFVAEGPIRDLASQAPAHISKLGTAQLLANCERAAGFLPESRGGELAVGAALDLIGMGEVEEAKRALDAMARDKPWTAALNAQVGRLIRYNDKSKRQALTEIAGYINAGVDPLASRAASAALAEEDAYAAALAGPDPLAAAGPADAFEIGEALRRPASGKALAVRYAMARPGQQAKAAKLTGLFDVAVRSGAAGDAIALEALLRGRHVVSTGRGYDLAGVAFMALGAKSFTAVIPGLDPAQRTYLGARPGERFRTGYSLASVSALVPHLGFAASARDLPAGSADLVLIELAKLEDLEAALADARHVARPNAKVRVRWRNPLSWSGHGQAPRRVSQIDRNDPRQAAVLDWRHLRKLDAATPALQQVRDAVEAAMAVDRWDERLDDPAAIMRISPRLRDAYPRLGSADLITASITASGSLKPA